MIDNGFFRQVICSLVAEITFRNPHGQIRMQLTKGSNGIV